MSYNRKITEYALLPNGAFPVDARSHFESLLEANRVNTDFAEERNHKSWIRQSLEKNEIRGYISFLN